MACLAALGPGEALRAKDLAELTSIPLPYLSKVLRKLVLEGLLDSQNGHHGGFSLSRPAKKITYADILRATEFDVVADHRCAFGWERCNAERPCALHGTYGKLKDGFQEWARKTTLADADLRLLRRDIAGRPAPE